MTKSEIKTFIEGVDPGAKHYWAALDGGSYTVWAETDRTGLDGDDSYAELGWNFEIVRYTTDEYDPMPQKIEDALLKDERIAFSYRVETRPEVGYILHSYVCSA